MSPRHPSNPAIQRAEIRSYPNIGFPQSIPSGLTPFETDEGIDLSLMRQNGEAVLPAPLPLEDYSADFESARSSLVALGAISTFGAAIAYSAFYTSATSDASDPTIMIYLAWSFTTYLVAGIITLIWQLALSGDSGRGPQQRFFRSTPIIVFALNVAVYCVIAGTVLLALVMIHTPSVSVRRAGYTIVVVLAAVPVLRAPRMWRPSWRRFLMRIHEIKARPRRSRQRTASTDARKFLQEVKDVPRFWFNAPETPLEPQYIELQRILGRINDTREREIAAFLLLHPRFGYATDYVLATTLPEKTHTEANVMADRIVYAVRAFNCEVSSQGLTGISESEHNAALSYLRLSQTYRALVKQLVVTDPHFWECPLGCQALRVLYLHQATLRHTTSNLPRSREELDSTAWSASRSARPHVGIQIEGGGTDAANAGNGSAARFTIPSVAIAPAFPSPHVAPASSVLSSLPASPQRIASR